MALFVYILCCLIWGSTWMAIKIGLTDAPPLMSAAVRFVLAVTIITAIVRIKGLKYPSGLREWLTMAHPGIYMYFGSYALVYFAEQYINSALTAVLFASYPIFVAVLSWLLLKKERLGWRGWMGLLLAFAGVVLISYDSLQTSPALFWGSALALGGSLVSAVGVVLHKRDCGHESIYVAANVQMAAGTLLLLLGALIFENPSDFAITPESIGSILYLAIFGTVIAFLGYYWLLTHMSVVTLSLITFVTPLIAILIGTVIGDEVLSTLTLFGAAAILAGIVLVVRK